MKEDVFMAKTYEEIQKYKEQLKKQQSTWSCLEYASKMYQFVTGTGPAGANDSFEYWEKASADERYMHALAPSVPIWFNKTGHAGFIEKIDSNGKIYYSDANGLVKIKLNRSYFRILLNWGKNMKISKAMLSGKDKIKLGSGILI